MAAYLVDTNVLLRFCDAPSPQHPVAWQAVFNLLARGDAVCVTPQNFIEFWAVTTRPLDVNGFGWSTQKTRSEIERLLGFMHTLEDTSDIFEHWFQLVTSQDIKGKRTHDARLVAVMHAHGVVNLLTFNVDDFKGYMGINVVHPNDTF